MSSEALYQIVFEFVGTGKVVKGQIPRFKAPLTFEALARKCPFSVRTRVNPGTPRMYWIVPIDIKKGLEKKNTEPNAVGDIVYCPMQDALFLVFDKGKIPFPLVQVGKVTEGLDLLKSFANGTMVKITLNDLSKTE